MRWRRSGVAAGAEQGGAEQDGAKKYKFHAQTSSIRTASLGAVKEAA